jgi:hydroxyacylglutathione hydrolase
LQERKQRDASRRERDEPTVPSQLGTELATNPFLRCAQPNVANHMAHRDGVDPADPVAVFAAVRGWKDQF